MKPLVRWRTPREHRRAPFWDHSSAMFIYIVLMCGCVTKGDCWHDKSVAKFHYKYAKRTSLSKTNLKIGIHVRYADDILVLCKRYEDAVRFQYSVTKYLTNNMKLEINEDKTRIYDLTREKMKYLGYDFYAFKQQTPNVKKRGKLMVANTLPKAKEDEIVKQCGILLHNIKQHPTFETIHNWNIYVVGITTTTKV